MLRRTFIWLFTNLKTVGADTFYWCVLYNFFEILWICYFIDSYQLKMVVWKRRTVNCLGEWTRAAGWICWFPLLHQFIIIKCYRKISSGNDDHFVQCVQPCKSTQKHTIFSSSIFFGNFWHAFPPTATNQPPMVILREKKNHRKIIFILWSCAWS